MPSPLVDRKVEALQIQEVCGLSEIEEASGALTCDQELGGACGLSSTVGGSH